MTFAYQMGRYQARLAISRADIAACQSLRHRCFFDRVGCDQDRFDHIGHHLMVCDAHGQLVATARWFDWMNSAGAQLGYTGQFYDLSQMATQDAPMVELGRFCIAPGVMDADCLRVAWGVLTQHVDHIGAKVLFGCTSFAGTDPALYGRVFARLLTRHLGPGNLRPKLRLSNSIRFADVPYLGARPMPPLLRTYLAMGGWVSDHAVIDPQMQTLHVFTCLEVAKVPQARARALRALAPASALP